MTGAVARPLAMVTIVLLLIAEGRRRKSTNEGPLKKPLTEGDILLREAIDGRVAFTAATFAVIGGLLALLDRIGVPPSFVAVFGPVAIVTGFAVLGLFLRNMRISLFYVAGHTVPATYAGMAFGALSVAVIAPFAASVPNGLSMTALLAAAAGGLFLAAVIGGPLLRKTGAFSVPDLICARFPNGALRPGVSVVVAIACGLVAIAGYTEATMQFARASGLAPFFSLMAVGVMLLLIVVPGGLSGSVWIAAGAAAVLMAGLALPVLLAVTADGQLPFPVIGDRGAWTEALQHVAAWDTGRPAEMNLDKPMIAVAVIGLAALAPLLSPAIATADRASAQGAGLRGLVWALVTGGLIAVAMALASLAMVQNTAGMPLDRLPQSLLEASGRGDLAICGAHPATAAAARAACGGVLAQSQTLRPDQIVARGSFLMVSLPALRGLGSTLTSLMTAGVTMVALALAAAGVQGFGTAIGHDLFYRARASSALTSRRLAATRFIMLCGVAGAALIQIRAPVDPVALLSFAIALSATVVAPLLLLSLWPRAQGMDAVFGLVGGLATAEVTLWAWKGEPAPSLFAMAALYAAMATLAIGVLFSLLRRAEPTSQGLAFVHGVLHGEGDVLNPDKGA